ncbi:hypothetical protein OG429_31820 [Streptomyces sp. NBC_00190]|uniref:hypothetical protein n=1 Tax=unclassified Streptomyces TaxID=2593676 RepID=UPI002E28E303|nr:hypothetical protein [Streptomyces sp. NBC_00190]
MHETALPPVWFRLPPGFHDIGPEDRASLDAVAHALGSPDARQELAQLVDGLDELAGLGVVHTAIGLHPDEPVGVCTSLFSLSIRPTDEPNPRVAAARTALGIARSAAWAASARRFIDLPSSLPCYLVAGTINVPRAQQHVFQARIATSHPGGLHVLVLDVTSAATQHHGAYTEILEAIALTLSFTDPDPSPPPAPRASRILEVLL